jgi:hypothetical protein
LLQRRPDRIGLLRLFQGKKRQRPVRQQVYIRLGELSLQPLSALQHVIESTRLVEPGHDVSVEG